MPSLDAQSAGKELICTIRSNTKLKNFKNNVTECGVSVTSFADKYYFGAEIEDSISIGRQLRLAVDAGRMGGNGQVAYGGSVETTLRGKDYPVRNEKASKPALQTRIPIYTAMRDRASMKQMVKISRMPFRNQCCRIAV
ncbi:AIG1-type G domain-containing protein [Forsythia ovata]|uniref:AIG1-type G domain-containing protein n=1 Tax=Forsythia ovata TaxID=205694 RepID=A0ABD1SLZ4_9LAMI